jgi:hypothetical protein
LVGCARVAVMEHSTHDPKISYSNPAAGTEWRKWRQKVSSTKLRCFQIFYTIMILDRLSIFTSKEHSLLSPLQTKVLVFYSFRHPISRKIKSACGSLLINTLCLSKPKLPSLGLLITFVNNFQFNLFLI